MKTPELKWAIVERSYDAKGVMEDEKIIALVNNHLTATLMRNSLGSDYELSADGLTKSYHHEYSSWNGIDGSWKFYIEAYEGNV